MTAAIIAALVFLACSGAVYAAGVRERRARGSETSAPGASPSLNTEVMLWAIRQVESGDNMRAIGKRGERTSYQFMRNTWARYTPVPLIHAADNPALAHRVAGQHLAAVLRALKARGLPAEPVFIAAAWCGGTQFPLFLVRSDYARRVANLYTDRVEGKS